MEVTIKLIGLGSGGSSPFDGQYVKAYDPHKNGTDPNGREMNCYLETTPNITDALIFPTAYEALEFWRQQVGLRPDGKPNRPLTAFTVEIS